VRAKETKELIAKKLNEATPDHIQDEVYEFILSLAPKEESP
jgi:hypothetical protein